MKTNPLSIISLALSMAVCAALAPVAAVADDGDGDGESQAEGWLHVYGTDQTYRCFGPGAEATFGTASAGNALTTVTIDGTTMRMSYIDRMTQAQNIPELRITTDTPVNEPPDKENYLTGTYTLTGFGVYDDAEGDIQIRGRGNSTWGYPKKPYRLHFDKKTSLCGLKKAKNFVLLANYLDPALMRNAVAMKVAQMVGTPYANHMVPVNVWLNDRYKGSYMLTEKVGINSSSVDIDEQHSVMFEFDSYFDEPQRFYSSVYQLPVMHKDPDMTDEQFEQWMYDFLEFEQLVAQDRLAEGADLESAVACMMTFAITGNQELQHPKSYYVFKTSAEGGGDGLYHFGPVWDFDWCYGYNPYSQYTLNSPRTPLLNVNSWEAGNRFNLAVCQNPDFLALYAQRWQEFLDAGGPEEVLAFFDRYSRLIEPTAARDGVAYPQSQHHDQRAATLRTWLSGRFDYLRTAPHFGLY